MRWFGTLIGRKPRIRAACVQKLGADCPDVGIVQQRLNRHGAKYGIHVDVDCVYGPITRNAVRRFQAEAMGMDSDGFIGPQTSRRLRVILIEDS